MAQVLDAPVREETEKPAAVNKPFYKKPVYIVAIAVLSLVGIIWGLRYYLYSMSHESTDDAFIDAHIVEISPKVSGYILKVYVKDNQQVKQGDLLAEIDAKDYQAKLDQVTAAMQAAEAMQRSADKNVDLTRVTTSANVQQAASAVEAAGSAAKASQAQAQTARERHDQARAQVAAAVAALNQARADVVAAAADRDMSKADLKRYQDLYERDEVSKQRLDQAVTGSQTTEARLEAARQKAATAEAQVNEAQAAERAAAAAVSSAVSSADAARAQVGEARGKLTAANSAPQQVAVSQANAENAGADINQQKAEVEQANLNLSYTKIYAPIGGRVTRKAIEIGSYVQIGQALMAIVPEEVWVTANFKETQLNDIRPGQHVDIYVDAYPGKTFNGHVDSIQAGTGARFSLLPPENATGNYVKVVQRVPVKILLDEPPDSRQLLAPGMSVVPEVRIK